MSPRGVDTESRKEEIIIAARQLFAEKGFYGASMNDLVAASGLSKGGVYWHFASKEAIILAILEDMFAHDGAAVMTILAGEDTAVDKIHAIMAHSCAVLLEMSDLLPVIYEFYALANRQAEVRAFFVAYLGEYTAVLTDLITQAVAHQELQLPPHVPPTAVAQTLAAQFEGQLLLAVLTENLANLAENIDTAVGLILQTPTPSP